MRNHFFKLGVLFVLLMTSICIAGAREVYHYVPIDGLTYNLYLEDNGTGHAEVTQPYDTITHKWGDIYTGDVYIPPTVAYKGVGYTVTYIWSGFHGEITSLHIPNTISLIGEYAFVYSTGLDSINLPMRTILDVGVFNWSDFRKFYFRQDPDNPVEYMRMWLGMAKDYVCEEVDLEPVSYLQWDMTPTQRLNLHHVDTLRTYGLEDISICVLDDTIPPAVIETGSPDRTFEATIYVPDPAFESYATHPFWGRVKAVKPRSLLDEELSSAVEETDVLKPEELKVEVDRGTIRVIGDDDSPCMIFDMEGSLVTTIKPEQETAPLTPGVYIVTCGNQRTKVVVR